MKTSFDFSTGRWTGDNYKCLSQYDLVFRTPPTEPIHHGLAVGNGDLGALIWTEKDKIIMQVNKCDLWDTGHLKEVRNWSETDEETACCLRHACRLVIDFGMPVFDTFYLKDFKAVLRIADGTVTVDTESVFGKLHFLCYADFNSNVIVTEVKTEFCEPSRTRVHIERYGSRTFSHWYAQHKTDASTGIAGTSAFANKNICGIRQELTDTRFVALLLSKEECTAESSRKAGFSFDGETSFYLAVTSPTEADPLPEAFATAKGAAGNGELFEKHSKGWRGIFSRSHMEYGDRYLDALWHLQIYYLAASQRGKYPGRFINGLWGWSRDVQNWNYYFHWNQQELYWGLNAAGLHELCEPYLDFRFRAMDFCRQDAEKHFNADGIWVSDVCDARGMNSMSELHNRTPVFEIAMDFYRQYSYTRDESFLREKAAPYITEAAKFLLSLAEKQNEGLWHFPHGSCYEGGFQGLDTVIELSCAKVLLPAAVDVAEKTGIGKELVDKWRDILDNMADFTYVESDRSEISLNYGKCTYEKGHRKGETAPSNKVISAGKSDALGVYVNSMVFEDFAAFPTTRTAPAFPIGCIGVKDRGTERYEAQMNALRLSSPAVMGWDCLPVAYARMGMGYELEQELKTFPKDWFRYENGFGHYNPHNSDSDFEGPFRYKEIRDLDNKGNTLETGMKPFAHMGFEPSGVITAAIAEQLLQSYDGVIRIAPAATENTNAKFTLHAAGGFLVSSEIIGGKPLWVFIESLAGEPFIMENPWGTSYLEGNAYTESSVSLETVKGGKYLFTPEPDMATETKTPRFKTNEDEIRHESGAQLGLGRKF